MKFYVFSIKYRYNINFIYSVDRVMDFNRAEPTCYRTNFPYSSSSYQNAAFTYIVLPLTYIRGLILELGLDFSIGGEEGHSEFIYFFSSSII